MTTKNDSSKKLFGSSWEIWDFLINKAGLDVKKYDLHIVNAICNLLK